MPTNKSTFTVFVEKIFTVIHFRVEVRVMVVNATFNNISVISWWSVLLVDETGVPGKNHRPAFIEMNKSDNLWIYLRTDNSY